MCTLVQKKSMLEKMVRGGMESERDGKRWREDRERKKIPEMRSQGRVDTHMILLSRSSYVIISGFSVTAKLLLAKLR